MLGQLARYTIRYQVSDLHLGLYSSLTSADNLKLPTLFYFSLLFSILLYPTLPPSSSIVAVFISFYSQSWTCLG